VIATEPDPAACRGRLAISDSALDPPIGTYDHLEGVLGAPHSLLEYGDFECPYCREAVPVVAEVRRLLGDRLVFAFRHFPLAQVHPFALAAALAAEAAGVHGQFWPMHDRLFGGAEPRLRQADLRGYAEEIGVPAHKVVWPATQFVEDRVEADFNSGVRSGVRGTPTFFVDGELYRGDTTVDGLLHALEGADDRADDRVR
jgi:protein-disulfide isomerase